MIPLRDNVPSRRFPLVNYALIAANVLGFAYQLSLGGDRGDEFILHEALVPAKFWWGVRHLDPTATAVPLVLSMFLHGGILHIAGNMLYLYIFGDNVEDRLGHVFYFFFYIFTGTVAALAQVVASPGSHVPMVGASGAIGGVMGAYLLFFPRARVLTLIPIFVFIEFIEVPAVLFLLFWFVIQFFSGSLAIVTVTRGSAGGVAWWAHIGGFVAGAGVALLVRGDGYRRY